MKILKTSLVTALALGALIALGPLARAQDNKDSKDTAKPDRPPAGQRERRAGPAAANFDRFAQTLKLTDEQKPKVQPIWQEQMTKMRELRQDTSLTTEQRREKGREIREQFLAKMKSVVTTEQYDELKKMPAGGPIRGGGPRGVRQGGDAKPPASGDQEKK